MIEATGDLWSFPADFRCITTNGVVDLRGFLVMGAGCALQAKKRFPALPSVLGGYVWKYGNRAFIHHPSRIITFPTKHNWQDKSDLALICQSAIQVSAIADKYDISSIVVPRPGCGNGGLMWSKVGPLLADILDNRFTVVTL